MAAQFNDIRNLRIDRRWRPLLWVLAGGLVLRFLYFAEKSRSLFFNVPLLDEKFYDDAAASLLGGGSLAALNPAFRSLGYPAFLALFRAFGGDSGRILAILAQHTLGLATALLVAGLAGRLFRSPAAAAAAAAIYLLAGPPLYFEGELLAETLFTFETTLVAALLVRCAAPDPAREPPTGRGLGPWLAAGTAIGLAAATRPNALVAAGVLLLLAATARRPIAFRVRAALAGAVALLVTLLLAAALQTPWLGSFELLPSQGGVNLFLGNKRGADGMIPRQGEATSYGDAYRDSVELWSAAIFERELGRPPAAPAELSRFWIAKTRDEIATAPWAWLGLLGRKAVYLLANAEIPNNKSYAFALAEESRLLPLLPVRFDLLLALATLGGVAAFKLGERRALAAVLLLAAALALAVIAFFVNARFRLPLWPLLAALAGGVVRWPALPPRPRAWAAAAAAGLGFFSLLAPPRPEQLPGFGRDYFFRSLAAFEKGLFAEARRDAQKAAQLEPADAAARVQLGNAALAEGDRDAAYQAFGAAVTLLPREPRGFHNLGVVFEKLGKPGDAYAAYLRAIELSRDFSPPYLGAALLEIRAGLPERAAAHLEQVAASAGDSVPYLCARAFLAHARGDDATAESLLAEAAARDPAIVAELGEKNRQRLILEDGIRK